MPAASADRNLLFGMLAVQLNFVSHDDLVAATNHWVLHKERPLGEVLVERGVLSAEESQLVEGAVQTHLKRHNNDPRQCLESMATLETVRATLDKLQDEQLRSTVEFNTLPMVDTDPHLTQAPHEFESAESRQRFKVLRLHQKGGLGRVSIALDEELNREIALKEILAAHADNIENRTRFVREAEITGALEHPGIVPVYSLGKFADGRPYYAMRFIRGMNLQMALEDYHKPGDDAAAKQLLFRQLLGRFVDVCLALEYAHSRGVIHRDLKPGNIMLGDYGETLVVDWGLAKTLEDGFETEDTLLMPVQPSERASSTSTLVGRVVGTPSYMSPEQAAGRLEATGPASDIYSLGATLYHLLSGQVAFSGTESEVLSDVQLGRFAKPREVNPQVSRALEAICLKAMARLPAERYTSGRELAADIERFLAGERVLAYDEPLAARAWRWTRHHKSLVVSSAAALAVALTALTISVVSLSAANVRVRASRDEATRSYQEADRQRQRAERNFGLARDAVRDYYISVSEETLLKQPGLQPLRESLLRQALVYYQGFLDERQDDPTLREEVAQAHFFTGQITQAIDSPANALPHYQLAAEAQRQLLASSPESRELATAYGKTLNGLGDASLRMYEFGDAKQYFQQAIDLRERLAQADPENVEAARTLASSVMNIGSVLYRLGDWEEAIERMNHAQTIRLAHAGQEATTPANLRRDLGMGYFNLALSYKAIGDTTRAEDNYLSAIQAFEQLLQSAPNDMNHQRKLAVCRRMVGQLYSDLGDSATAIEYFKKARQMLAELQRRNPDMLEFTSDLSGVCLYLGRELAEQQQLDLAIESIEQSIQLLRELLEQAETVPRFRLDLAISLREAAKLLARSGEPETSLSQLQESQSVIAQLVREEPSNEVYGEELRHTNDELARVTASQENAILRDAEATP